MAINYSLVEAAPIYGRHYLMIRRIDLERGFLLRPRRRSSRTDVNGELDIDFCGSAN